MMLRELTLWTEKLRMGYAIGIECYKEFRLALPSKITKIVFVGMGGSGIAGRIIKTFSDQQAKIPVFVLDTCVVPSYVDHETLAIVASYSGNTWETLMAFEQLRVRAVPMIIMSHAGELRQKAQLHNLPFAQLPASLTPRSSLGNTLGFLYALFELLGILSGKRLLDLSCKATDSALVAYEQEQFFEPFLYAADTQSFFHVWGVSGYTDAVAYRAQTQFNENSKLPVVTSMFPELCHNVLVGFSAVEKSPFILVFGINGMHETLIRALGLTMALLEDRGVTLYKPAILGDTLEEQLLAVILWADFASCFLAKARRVEAQPVYIIDTLKERHKQHNIGS